MALPAACTHNREHFVAAADEQTPVLDVHVHGRGFFRWRDGPAGLDGSCAGVDSDDFVFVLNVVVDHSFTSGNGVFRPAAHWYGGGDGAGAGIDDGSVIRFAVHRENMFGSRSVNGSVRVGAG